MVVLAKICNQGRRVMRAAIGALLFMAMSTVVASAQVNCGAARTPQMRAWCYGQSAQIYQQQSRAYNDIARWQWQQYQNAPRYVQPFRMVPGGNAIVGPAIRAWRAPGYYYQYRYGRP